MADPKALEVLQESVRLWNEKWSSLNRDLSKADLHGRDLTAARFEATNLACSNLEGCDLSSAHFERADLTGASFGSGDGGANLCDAQLREAKLRDCNLSSVKGGLQHQQLAGADLTGATLPAALTKLFDNLDLVADVSERARKLFISMLAACVYSWLTIATTTDFALITNRASSPLPIIQTSIPIVGFYVVTPLLLLCLYLYFHLYLQKLWDEFGSLPAIFPDGRRLDERSDPWLLNDLVRAHVVKLKDDRPFMSYFQQGISVVLAWWLVPITLLLFWGRYLPRHDPYWMTFQAALLAASITAALYLYHFAALTLRGVERKPFSWRGALRSLWGYSAVGTFWAIGAAVIVISVGAIRGIPPPSYLESLGSTPHVDKGESLGCRSWVPRAMDFVRYSPFASVAQADISMKPPNWTGKSSSELDLVKGAQLGGVDLRYADARYVFLANAYLEGANLEGISLEGSDLRRAFLLEASLDRANLDNTALAEVTLNGANLKQATLRLATLNGAYLQEADLTRVDLSFAKLRGADLLKAQLSGAQLEYADLRGAILTQADLTGANLEEADLTFADFRSQDIVVVINGVRKWALKTRKFTSMAPQSAHRYPDLYQSRKRTEGLTVDQLKEARNWNKAFYDDDVRLGLGLPPDYNKALEDEQKREQQQEGQPTAGDTSANGQKGPAVRSTNIPKP